MTSSMRLAAGQAPSAAAAQRSEHGMGGGVGGCLSVFCGGTLVSRRCSIAASLHA